LMMTMAATMIIMMITGVHGQIDWHEH